MKEAVWLIVVVAGKEDCCVRDDRKGDDAQPGFCGSEQQPAQQQSGRNGIRLDAQIREASGQGLLTIEYDFVCCRPEMR